MAQQMVRNKTKEWLSLEARLIFFREKARENEIRNYIAAVHGKLILMKTWGM